MLSNDISHREEGPDIVDHSDAAAAIGGLSERQVQILRVATELFHARGYHGTRMDDVAAGASLNKATIYHYFQAKADILFTLCLQSLTEALAGITPPGREAADPVSDLAAFTKAVLELTARELPRTAVYFQEAPFIEQWLSESQVAQLRDLEGQFDSHVTDIFKRGIAEGTFAASDARIAALGYTGMVSWFYRWYDTRGPMSVDDITWQFLNLVVTDQARARIPQLAPKTGKGSGSARKPASSKR